MQTKIIGHRGFKSQYPENTLKSFEAALLAGADGLEFDVHYSKDGELVVYHDFNLEALTGTSGHIFDYSASELTKMTIEKNGIVDTLPLLEDVLALIDAFSKKNPERNLMINVELKAGSHLYPMIESKTTALCSKYLSMDQYIFSSFDHEALINFKKIDSALKTGVLTQSALYKTWDYMKTLEADFYHPHYMILLEPHLKQLLLNGVKINTYTVNDPLFAKSLFAANINALITDNVSQMIALKKEVSIEAGC